VDAVINHMCGNSGTGRGSAGSWYNADEMQFPGVPYGPDDFNCCQCGDANACATSSCNIENYTYKNQVQHCVHTNYTLSVCEYSVLL